MRSHHSPRCAATMLRGRILDLLEAWILCGGRACCWQGRGEEPTAGGSGSVMRLAGRIGSMMRRLMWRLAITTFCPCQHSAAQCTVCVSAGQRLRCWQSSLCV